MALKEKQDRLLSILDHMINETLSGQKSPLSTSRNSCQEKVLFQANLFMLFLAC